MKKQHDFLLRGSASISLALLLAACSGGGSSSGNGSLDASALGGVSPGASTPGATTSVDLPAPAAPDTTQPVLNLPASVANNSIVELECGRSYAGTLDLRGKSGVTVRTSGVSSSCGKAVISPGRAITGWTQYQGQVWSAPIGFDAAQVMVGGTPIERAHWPNRPQTWARSTAASGSSLSYNMPNADLAGATLVYRPYDWAIEGRSITGYANGVMSLAANSDAAYGGFAPPAQADFYVEGKLWMLDAPGEWAVSNGRLYVWAPDGASPEGRTWASPDKHGVDAENASNIVLQDVAIYGSANAINAGGARNLQVSNVDIGNASRYGIWNAGGTALKVEGASIRNVRNDAIAVRWGGGNEVIRNSRIEASGVVGMPTNSRAAINLTLSSGSTIEGNTVKNSGYIGIRFFRNAMVTGNTVDGACQVLTDCGGMYGMADDGLPLSATVQNNSIANAGPGQHLAWGIYLDNADGMKLLSNTFSGNGQGINIQDSSNVTVTGNAFKSSSKAHVQMVETTANRVRGNSVRGNSFTSLAGEESYRLSSDLGSSAVQQFATYDANTYVGVVPVFANFNGAGLSFTQWKAQTGQDSGSSWRAN